MLSRSVFCVVLASVVSAMIPYPAVLYNSPQMGTVISISELSLNLEVSFNISNFLLEGDHHILFRLDGTRDLITNSSRPLSLRNVEAGTHTISATCMFKVSEIAGPTSTIVFDVVPEVIPTFSEESMLTNDLGVSYINGGEKYFGQVSGSHFPSKTISISLIGSMILDGQKTIWLQQLKHLTSRPYLLKSLANSKSGGEFTNFHFKMQFVSHMCHNNSVTEPMIEELRKVGTRLHCFPHPTVDGTYGTADFPLNILKVARQYSSLWDFPRNHELCEPPLSSSHTSLILPPFPPRSIPQLRSVEKLEPSVYVFRFGCVCKLALQNRLVDSRSCSPGGRQSCRRCAFCLR